jgi:hypothetical protein
METRPPIFTIGFQRTRPVRLTELIIEVMKEQEALEHCQQLQQLLLEALHEGYLDLERTPLAWLVDAQQAVRRADLEHFLTNSNDQLSFFYE